MHHGAPHRVTAHRLGVVPAQARRRDPASRLLERAKGTDQHRTA